MFVSLDIFRLRPYSVVVKQPYQQSGDTGSIPVGELSNFLRLKLENKLFIIYIYI